LKEKTLDTIGDIKVNTHIYVNSHPRSASTYLVRLLQTRYGYWDNLNDHLLAPIWKEHFQQVLLASIPSTLQITLVRDPIDCLVSSTIKDIGDFVEVTFPDSKNFYDSYFKNKISVYNEYLDNTISNHSGLMPISFESVTLDIHNIVEKIDSVVDLIPIEQLDLSIDKAVNAMKKSNNYNFFHHNYPMNKTNLYNEYKKTISSYKDNYLKESYEKYNYLKSEILL
jgi:hypothetical protein